MARAHTLLSRLVTLPRTPTPGPTKMGRSACTSVECWRGITPLENQAWSCHRPRPPTPLRCTTVSWITWPLPTCSLSSMTTMRILNIWLHSSDTVKHWENQNQMPYIWHCLITHNSLLIIRLMYLIDIWFNEYHSIITFIAFENQ